MDRGHERTEQVISKIEGRLRAEYEQAAKEVEETLKDYMERFDLKDKKWQEWVKDGKRTQEQYDAWRKQQLMQGERWKQLKNQLANDMVNTTSAARDIVQSYMPEVYEINANYALYQVEVGGGYTLPSSLTLYNREAIARLVKDEPDLMPMGKSVLGDIARGKAQRWERQKVQSIMMQGILQGKSNVRIAKDIAENLANGDFKASMRYARTMSTNAQNGGRYGAYRRLEENGVPLTLQWEATLDMRTRHEHRMMHGQRRNVNQPFEVDGVEILYPAWLGMGDYKVPPDMIWNCFVGDTNVATDSEIQKSYKHKYSGELITINTASGINFTCTPNHPILTPRGWVAAALLNKGDDLLVTSGGNGAIFRGNGNVNHVHSTMKALHETLLNFGGVIQSPMTNFNFHGDIPTSDVEIVCKEGELGVNLDTRIANSVNKSLFKNPDTLSSGKGHFMPRFGGIDVSTLSFVSRTRKALSLLWRSARHTDKHCLGAVAGGDSCVSEYAINDLPAMANIRSELLNGLSGKVFVDNVVAVDRKPSGLSCHVYNLQTENGYYFVGNSITHNGETYNGNMVIAKNCRCTILAFVKGFEHDALKTSERMEGLSYEDWLNAKERPDPITKQRDIGEMMRMRYIREYGGDGSGLRKEEPKVEYKQLASGDEANKYFGQRPERSLRRSNREEYDRQRELYEKSMYGRWYNNLTGEQVSAIGAYTGDTYAGINGLLRGQMTERMVDQWNATENMTVQRMIEEITTAIKGFELDEPINVLRYCDPDVLRSLPTEAGAIFHDDGFGSTCAIDKKVSSGNVRMNIHVPAGKGYGAYVNPLSGAEDDEYEFLLQRGTDYRVVSIAEQDGETVVDLEVVGQTDNGYKYATKEQVIQRWKEMGIYEELKSREKDI